MVEILHYPASELPIEIGCQISGFVRLVWLSHLRGEDRFWTRHDPTSNTQHFVVVERGVLISHAGVIQREIAHLGESYRLMGLSGVFTYPDFRGEGYGTQVVEAATQYIRASGVDIGMLFTGLDLDPFYLPIGWERLRREGIHFGDPAQPQFDDSHLMMLYLSDKAKARRDDFEAGELYVGKGLW